MKGGNLPDNKPLYAHYHCFADNNDDWFRSLREAIKCIKSWKAQGYTNLRIYEVGVYTVDNGETYEDEGCYVYGKCQFPL